MRNPSTYRGARRKQARAVSSNTKIPFREVWENMPKMFTKPRITKRWLRRMRRKHAA